jgi:hypothetical protein
MRKIAKFLIVLVISTFFCQHSEAQVNFKIGYNPAYGPFKSINTLLSQYDAGNLEVKEDFGSLHFIHGIQLGVRYSIAPIAFEFGWDHLNRDRSSLAFNSTNETFHERTYAYSMNTFLLGVDSYFGVIGFGTFITSSSMKINRKIGDNDLSISNERQMGARIHLNITLQKSDYITFVLKPFYQFPLRNFDLSGLATDLNLSNSSDVSEPAQLFGLSFVFYNGRQ